MYYTTYSLVSTPSYRPNPTFCFIHISCKELHGALGTQMVHLSVHERSCGLRMTLWLKMGVWMKSGERKVEFELVESQLIVIEGTRPRDGCCWGHLIVFFQDYQMPTVNKPKATKSNGPAPNTARNITFGKVHPAFILCMKDMMPYHMHDTISTKLYRPASTPTSIPLKSRLDVVSRLVTLRRDPLWDRGTGRRFGPGDIRSIEGGTNKFYAIGRCMIDVERIFDPTLARGLSHW
jgi:hypothetical protein